MSKRKWISGPPPSVEYLKTLFVFNPETGVLAWSVSKAPRLPIGSVAGTNSGNGYKKVMVDGKNLYVHRIAFAMSFGTWPEQIDHLNGDRSDNRIENLRGVTNMENCHNKHFPKKNRTGVSNVCFDERYGTYRAMIHANKVRFYLGTFKSLQDAKIAVANAKELHQSTYWPKNARVARQK